MSTDTDIQSLLAAMAAYFEGLYQADPDILAPLFHEDARYVNATAGDYMNFSKAEYLAIVAGREAPSATGDVRRDEIVSIEIGNGPMAFVTARMQMMGRQYQDFLTFQKTNEGWQIQAKVFTYHLI